MLRIVALLVVCSGCDLVFGLHRDADADAGGDDDDAAVDTQVQSDAPSHDEDADGLVDLVDPCPADAGDAGDMDGDSVGNLCDPSEQSVEHLVFFDPFVTDTGSWVNVAGIWGYGVDTLAGGGGLGAGLAEIQHDIDPTDHATFEATFESTRPLTSLTGVRITFEGGKVFSCLVYVDVGGAQMVNLYEDATLKQMATFVGTSAMHLSLTHLAADNSIRCRARIDGQPATLVDYPAALSARGDKISIVAKDSEIDVWSAVVFATQ